MPENRTVRHSGDRSDLLPRACFFFFFFLNQQSTANWTQISRFWITQWPSSRWFTILYFGENVCLKLEKCIVLVWRYPPRRQAQEELVGVTRMIIFSFWWGSSESSLFLQERSLKLFFFLCKILTNVLWDVKGNADVNLWIYVLYFVNDMYKLENSRGNFSSVEAQLRFITSKQSKQSKIYKFMKYDFK